MDVVQLEIAHPMGAVQEILRQADAVLEILPSGKEIDGS
jgi:hypothetical protein